MSLGFLKLLPVKRRMVAWSMSLSTVATAWASEGKKDFQLLKPVLAARRMERLRCLAETSLKRCFVALESKGS
jgi:hypothetical protein